MAKVEPKLEEQCEALYEQMTIRSNASPEGKAKTFTQTELLDLGIVKKEEDLMGLLQGLADKQLVRFMSIGPQTVFALRARDVAQKICRLTQDERMVYTFVENQGLNGAWTKHMKQKTGLVQAVINKVIKTLEGRVLIKSVKNIKAPAQKSYILAHLDPGDDVTGGPWHSDGELDSEMIGISANVVIKFVESRSWDHKTVKVERHRSMSPIDMLGEPAHIKKEPGSPTRINGTAHHSGDHKRKRDDTADIEDLARRRKKYDKVEVQVAYPPGYAQYPTAAEIFDMLKNSGFIKNQLRMEDIQSFLDMLVMDERIERIGQGFRTIRGIRGGTKMMQSGLQDGLMSTDDQELDENGLTQTPCGRCPVFDLCEEGGPVNARNCEYFDTWLKA
ncbi:putative RNA polymerase Rpc34 subunit [Elsinoe australis]|uniref:DNA-directed RNA polymerase III subunit RPC6 n=1 Tax=Elsinoe australis TaxID=40998 RepID=A0A4U7B2S1_9PEZI|nr:putative RNA polymerase Rpc34 subunit [Elsinoe australis]